MLSITAIFIALVVVAYFYITTRRRSKSPPGPFPFPIIGSLLSMTVRPQLAFTKWAKLYGPIVQAKLGFNEVLILNDAKLIREAFNEPAFSGRPDSKIFSVLAGGGKHGIIVAEGESWVEQRRYLIRNLRDFGFGKKSMETLIYDEVNDVLQWMKQNEGLPVSVNKKFTFAVLNALWMIMTGNRYDHDETEHSSILHETIERFTDALMKKSYLLFFPQMADIFPDLSGWNKLQEIWKLFMKNFHDVVTEHEQDPADPDQPRDFIDKYLNEIKNTSDPNSSFYKEAGRHSLVTVISDVYGAGTGTTSATLTWNILYLMTHPSVQSKLQKELDTVIGNRMPNLMDRLNTPYMEAVIQEVLRISSIVPIGLFHAAMKDTIFQGYEIKKGTWVVGNLYSALTSVEHWGDPQNFRPERFLSENGKTLLRNEALIPFSVGKRQCLGETFARDQLYLFLAAIFQKFEVHPDPANPNPSLEAEPGIVEEAKQSTVIFKDRQ